MDTDAVQSTLQAMRIQVKRCCFVLVLKTAFSRWVFGESAGRWGDRAHLFFAEFSGGPRCICNHLVVSLGHGYAREILRLKYVKLVQQTTKCPETVMIALPYYT